MVCSCHLRCSSDHEWARLERLDEWHPTPVHGVPTWFPVQFDVTMHADIHTPGENSSAARALRGELAQE